MTGHYWGALQWSSFNQPTAKRADVTQCPRAVEGKDLGLIDLSLIPPDFVQPVGNLADRRRFQSGPGEQDAQGVDVVADRLAAQESGLNGSGPPPHERIVDGVLGLRILAKIILLSMSKCDLTGE